MENIFRLRSAALSRCLEPLIGLVRVALRGGARSAMAGYGSAAGAGPGRPSPVRGGGADGHAPQVPARVRGARVPTAGSPGNARGASGERRGDAGVGRLRPRRARGRGRGGHIQPKELTRVVEFGDPDDFDTCRARPRGRGAGVGEMSSRTPPTFRTSTQAEASEASASWTRRGSPFPSDARHVQGQMDAGHALGPDGERRGAPPGTCFPHARVSRRGGVGAACPVPARGDLRGAQAVVGEASIRDGEHLTTTSTSGWRACTWSSSAAAMLGESRS